MRNPEDSVPLDVVNKDQPSKGLRYSLYYQHSRDGSLQTFTPATEKERRSKKTIPVTIVDAPILAHSEELFSQNHQPSGRISIKKR